MELENRVGLCIRKMNRGDLYFCVEWVIAGCLDEVVS
jgi:hypothetical protein